MVDRAKFFNMVMSLTGVDLVANKLAFVFSTGLIVLCLSGIPPSPSRRSTAIPRRSNQTRVALGLREETVLPSSVSSGYSTLSSPTSTSNSNNLVYQPRIGLQRYCATSKTNEFEAAINERNEFGNDGNEEQENLRRSAASSETALADDLPEYPEDVHNVDGECDDISAYMDTAIMSPNDYSEQSRPQTLAEAGEDTAASNYDYDQDQNDDDGWSVQCGFNDDEELNVSDQGSVEEMHVLSFHGVGIK
jgi:hypothetical protein